VWGCPRAEVEAQVIIYNYIMSTVPPKDLIKTTSWTGHRKH
jgi:hypothetical protein